MTCLSRWRRWKSRTPKKVRPGSAARGKASTATGAATSRRWSRRSARATDYRKAGRGAHARNREQSFALNLLLDADINLATLLTARQMQTPLTRAGSKLVILGNIARIDTPASKTASGLSCAVDRSNTGNTAGISRCKAASAHAWPILPGL